MLEMLSILHMSYSVPCLVEDLGQIFDEQRPRRHQILFFLIDLSAFSILDLTNHLASDTKEK